MKKVIVICVIVLFVGIGFTSGIGVNVEQTSYPLMSGETAWWKFDETSGNTAYDSSGHGYDGNVVGATWTGNGLSFDGTDDYVDFDNHSEALGINKMDDYLIFVRFQSTESGMLYSMSHTNPDRAYFDLMLDEEGKITVEMGDETCLFDLSTTSTFNDGEWHLVRINFWGDCSNPTLEIYVDDELDGSKTEWMSPMLDEDFLTAKVGRDSNAETDYFDGEIDDIKIYKWNWNFPPYAPTIDGPNSGKPGESLTFIFNAWDPDDDDVRYHIDWGDGNTEWTSYVWSGTDKSVSHIWDAVDTYTITAYAEDEYGNYGPSSTFRVTMPRNRATNNVLFWRLIGQFPMLQKLLLQFGIYNN